MIALGTFSKYLAFAAIARRKVRRAPHELYGRAVFFGVILCIFSELWRAIAETDVPLSGDPTQRVWYLAVTEWIVLSVPGLNTSIEEDVRRGDVAYHLPRPVSYVASLMAQGIGQLSARLPVVGAAGFGFAWLFTGTVPAGSLERLWVIPLAVLSSIVLTALNVVIGLFAFWFGETMPIYWVCQKLLFVLGGLMLPLELYPSAVVQVARLTPFPALLYAPASLVTGATEGGAASIALSQIFWLVVIITLAALLFHRARQKLELSGG